MASPPYRSPAGSPPYPHNASLPNPKKRPSLSLSANQPSKRRKSTFHSAVSTPGGSHPLRQTSFPPEESSLDAGGARSPSIDSDITGVTGGKSTVTTGTTRKRKGGRRKKAEGSIISITKSKGGEGASAKDADDEVEDDEEDDEAANGMMDGGESIDKVKVRENLAVLHDAFNSDQQGRYESYRRTKLKKETVRKIVNSTLSQSVPPAVMTTIGGYIKVFIGLLIERAREVQEQSLNPLPTPPPDDPLQSQPNSNSRPGTSSSMEQKPQMNSSMETLDDVFASPSTTQGGTSQSTAQGAQDSSTAQQRDKMAPLLPDHLREALRRIQRDGDGGGTGMAGLSLGLGIPGSATARLGGRRLFK